MIRQKKHELLVRAAYDMGLFKGWDLCWQMKQAKALGELTSEIREELDKKLNKRVRGEMTPTLRTELEELLKRNND